jgi:transaldolase
MPDNPLLQLREHGQSVWLDNLDRTMIEDGSLMRRIREDGLSGITSNPKIFFESITSGDAHDGRIRELADRGLSPSETFETLAVADVRDACDRLFEVYERTRGDDGFVSLEVSPKLARDSEGTVEQATRLWQRVDRPNVFIKIPGTVEGLSAIEECLRRGINVNVTLLFALERYREVLEAWMRAMTNRMERREMPTVRSVASFFLSRIDSKVDPMLDEIASGGDEKVKTDVSKLRGRVAVASAKLAHEIWKRRLADTRPDWKHLQAADVAPQKLLWASTSTKDPDYSDTKYVEPLIGPQTVSTMPESTMDAFRDHGTVAATLERDISEQRSVLRRAGELGIDLERVTDALVEEGIRKFLEPYERLLEAIEDKMRALTGRYDE